MYLVASLIVSVAFRLYRAYVCYREVSIIRCVLNMFYSSHYERTKKFDRNAFNSPWVCVLINCQSVSVNFARLIFNVLG